MSMASRSTSRSFGEAGNMDARLWGDLQCHIDLQMIYAKLPIGDFFRLCQVCKDWNRLALDQAFLLESWRDPISSPHFIVDSKKIGQPRLLTYKASSWSWTRLPPMKCEAGGMLLCEDSNRVFNVHTRVFHSLPPSEEEDDVQPLTEPFIGLIVDSLSSSFQLILGHGFIGTRIYDSKRHLWMHKSSKHKFPMLGLGAEVINEEFDAELPKVINDAQYDVVMPKPTSVYYNDLLYIRVWAMERWIVRWHIRYRLFCRLHSYDAERDEWQIGEETWNHGDVESVTFCEVGVWQNRLFLFQMEDVVREDISVWENCGELSEIVGTWTLYDSMPRDLCAWMWGGAEFSERMEVQCKFCGEYVLIYNCGGYDDEEVTERAVLCNLDQKTWKKVPLLD